MATISEIQNEIEEEFALFDDWEMKYEHLIELGKELPLIEEQYKTEEYLVKGCQSQVWLRADLDNDNVVYSADSDAIITKGLIALLVRVFSNQLPEDIVKVDPGFIDNIGLREHLSPTRSNGLVAMINQMKLYAAQVKMNKQETGNG